MFPNNKNIRKHAIDEMLLSSWMIKRESDVVDDLFQAIQSIIAGTANVTNTVLSETCFQCKIHLSEDFPLITLQYEMKLDKKELVHFIPVVDFKIISDRKEKEKHVDTVFKDAKQTSFPVCNVKQEIPELLSVFNNIQRNVGEELLSFDCSQDSQRSEMNLCTKKSSCDFINNSNTSDRFSAGRELIALSIGDSYVISSETKEHNGIYKNTTWNERSEGIVKKNEMIKDEEKSDFNEKKYSCSYCGKLFKWKGMKHWHERFHTDQIPFTCGIPFKTFSQPFKLAEPKRIYTAMSSKKGGVGVKRKHLSISIQDKVELLQKLDCGVSVRQLCNDYGIGSSTVYDIKKQREKIMKFYADSDSKKYMCIRKTMKDGKSTDHDKVMMQWFRQRRSEGDELSGSMIMEQAKLFHEELGLEYDCDYGEGWLQRFKKRHGIILRKVCGEKQSTGQEGVAENVNEFVKIVTDEHLSSEQVYNADETTLYWRSSPGRILSTEDEEKPTGFKQFKGQIATRECSNIAGTQMLSISHK